MPARYSEFEGKHVLVTGAGAGIGRAVACAFSEEGAVVTGLDNNRDALTETGRSVSNMYQCVCDVTDLAALTSHVETAVRERGPISVLINNAGQDRRIPLSDQTSDEFRLMLQINLEHHALLSKLLAPGMQELGHGAIVNLSSTAWMKLAGNMTAYHAAKAGIIGLTRGLARDLGVSNIRVNAIAPGRVLTERTAALIDDEWVTETKSLQCLPHIIKPRDIARTALWLSSMEACAITGQTIIVDGGVA